MTVTELRELLQVQEAEGRGAWSVVVHGDLYKASAPILIDVLGVDGANATSTDDVAVKGPVLVLS